MVDAQVQEDAFLGKIIVLNVKQMENYVKNAPGYFSYENGGSSYANNCKIFYIGECIECKEDFILIGKF